MNKQLEQLCESLFERCKKDIDGIFSLWKESINSKLKLFDLIKRQLNHYGYMNIEESEFYKVS